MILKFKIWIPTTCRKTNQAEPSDSANPTQTESLKVTLPTELTPILPLGTGVVQSLVLLFKNDWIIKGHILHMTMAHSKLKKEIRELEKLRTFYKLKLDNMVSDLVYAANPWVIYRKNHKSC